MIGLPAFEAIKPMTYKFRKQISFTGTGTWAIEKVGTIDFGSGGLKDYWGLILDSAPDELRYAGLIGAEKPTGIMFTFGDPDSGEVIMLKKKVNEGCTAANIKRVDAKPRTGGNLDKTL
jgi:hypothetical protein